MDSSQNHTPSGDSSTPDPIDRIEAFLAADDGDSTAGTDNKSAEPAQPAATTDKPSDGEPGKVQEPQFTTAHLAQFLGIDESMVDVDEEGQPVFKTKIDGKEQSAKFQDFLKDHQLKGHAENTTREAAEIRKAAEARMHEAEQVIQARFQQQQESLKQLDAMNAALMDDLRGEYQAVNWDALWQADPAQARSLERRFEQRQARLNSVGQQIQQRDAAAAQEANAQRAMTAQKTLQAEAQVLKTVIPEWNDRATASKEQSELTDWALSRGYDPSYLNALHNAQVPNSAIVIRDLRNAWKHDTMQKSKPDIENRVRTAPKLVKPGQAPSTDANAADLKSLKQQVRQTGANSQKALEAYLLKSGKA